MEKLNAYIITAALEVAAKNPDGFTISWDMTEQPVTGYAVALPNKGHHGTVGFLTALALAIEKTAYFGGWMDKNSGIWYWDTVEVYPLGQLEAAMKAGKRGGEIAIYDIGNAVDIRLK